MVGRVQATSYLAGHYGAGANNLLALADIPDTDTTGGLKEPIDDAMLLLSIPYATLATGEVGDSDALTFHAALRYTGLRRIIDGLNAKSQQGVAEVGQGVSLDVREWIKRLQTQLDREAAQCASVGLDVGGASGGSWASLGDQVGVLGLNLDYLIPMEVTDQ